MSEEHAAAVQAEASVDPTRGREHRAAAAEAAPAAIGPELREVFSRIADVLIPAGSGMPSASEAGVAGPWLDELLRSRPDMADDLQRVLAGAREGDAATVVTDMQSQRPDDFAVLEVAVPGAYFMNPETRRLLGYPGQQAIPIPVTDRPDYEEDGLIDSVISRGTIYRT